MNSNGSTVGTVGTPDAEVAAERAVSAILIADPMVGSAGPAYFSYLDALSGALSESHRLTVLVPESSPTHITTGRPWLPALPEAALAQVDDADLESFGRTVAANLGAEDTSIFVNAGSAGHALAVAHVLADRPGCQAVVNLLCEANWVAGGEWGSRLNAIRSTLRELLGSGLPLALTVPSVRLRDALKDAVGVELEILALPVPEPNPERRNSSRHSRRPVVAFPSPAQSAAQREIVAAITERLSTHTHLAFRLAEAGSAAGEDVGDSGTPAIVQVLHDSAVALVPSDAGAVGLDASVAAIQAMAMGVPIVTNADGWLADLVREHRCGAVVEGGSALKLVAAVYDAVLDGEEMAENASKTAAEYMGPDPLGRVIRTLTEPIQLLGSPASPLVGGASAASPGASPGFLGGRTTDTRGEPRELPGWMHPTDLAVVAELAQGVSPDGVIVEVGSWMGQSTHAWASNTDATLYAVDLWEWMPKSYDGPADSMVDLEGDPFSQFIRNVGDHENMIPIRRNSSGGPWPYGFADLVFIDAMHQNPWVAEDIRYWENFLKPGGVICGDAYAQVFLDVMIEANACAKRFGVELELPGQKFWVVRTSGSFA